MEKFKNKKPIVLGSLAVFTTLLLSGCGGEKVSENEPNSVAMTSSVQLEEDANNDNQISKQVNELERDFKKWKKMSGSEKQNIAHDLWVRAGDLYTETTDPVLEVKLEEIYNVTQEY